MSNFIFEKDGSVSIPKEKQDFIRARMLRQINFPMDLKDKKLDDFDIYRDASGAQLNEADTKKKSRALEVVMQYRDALENILGGVKIIVESSNGQTFSSNSITFCGKESSGKTLLIASLLRESLLYSIDVEYVKWLSIINVSSKFATDAGYIEMQKKFQKKKLIAIDDIYDAETHAMARTNMAALLDIRVHTGFPTLLGSNLSPEILMEKMPHPGRTLVAKSIIIPLPDSQTQLYTVI